MVDIAKRKYKSLLRAEEVARELRDQLAHNYARNGLDMNRLLAFVERWMRVTGNIKYIRPEKGGE